MLAHKVWGGADLGSLNTHGLAFSFAGVICREAIMSGSFERGLVVALRLTPGDAPLSLRITSSCPVGTFAQPDQRAAPRCLEENLSFVRTALRYFLMQ